MKTFNEILKDFKFSLSMKKMFLRYISYKWWFRLLIFVIVDIAIGIYGINKENTWFLIPYSMLLVILFLLILKKGEEIKNTKYESEEDYENKHYEILIKILKKHSIFIEDNKDLTRFNMQTLLDIANQKLNRKKTSSLFVGFLISMVPILLKLFVSNTYLLFQETIITLIIMIIGLFLMIWPLLREILDKELNKIEDLRNMLYEILLKRIN